MASTFRLGCCIHGPSPERLCHIHLIMNACIGIQYSWPGILDYVSSLVGEIKHYADYCTVQEYTTAFIQAQLSINQE